MSENKTGEEKLSSRFSPARIWSYIKIPVIVLAGCVIAAMAKGYYDLYSCDKQGKEYKVIMPAVGEIEPREWLLKTYKFFTKNKQHN